MPLPPAHASISLIRGFGILAAMMGSVPVAGRPGFFFLVALVMVFV